MFLCYKYIWLHCGSFNYVFGAELSLFPVPSLFPLAGSSFWPKRSGTATWSPVALLVAMLLRRTKGGATEPFCVWPKWNSVVAQRIGWISSDVTRVVTTERVRNICSLLKSCSILCSCMNSKLIDFFNFNLKYCSDCWEGGYIWISS